MNTEQITLIIGIALTFVVGVANLIITFRNARKASFINSVTASRVKYIQEIRENIAKFCGLALTYNLKSHDVRKEDHFTLHKEADALKYLIRLYLNPEDQYWDQKIIEFCDEVIKNTDKDLDDLNKAIDNLIAITQYLLKLEWEGVKEESKSGILSNGQKEILYRRYLKLYQEHAAENNK